MKPRQEHRSKNPLEWVVFALSLLLLLSAAGLLIAMQAKGSGGPARLTVETGESRLTGGGIEIPVTVTNHGRSAAANVHVTVSIGENGDRRESGFTLDFLAPGARRKGSVGFADDKLPPKPAATITGHSEP